MKITARHILFFLCLLFACNSVVYAQDDTSDVDCPDLYLQVSQLGGACAPTSVYLAQDVRNVYEYYIVDIVKRYTDGTEVTQQLNSRDYNDDSKPYSQSVDFSAEPTLYYEQVKYTVYCSNGSSKEDTRTYNINYEGGIPSPTVTNGATEARTGATFDLSTLVTAVDRVSSNVTTTPNAINWYGPDNYATALASSTVNTETEGVFTYYVSSTFEIDGSTCESARVPVTLTVNPPTPPEAPVTTNYHDCATAGDIDILSLVTAEQGATLKWYDAVVDGNEISQPVVSASTVGSSTYYVSQTVDGVEGARAAVQINVLEAPVAFAGDDAQVCQGESVQLGTNPEQDRTYSWTPERYLDNATSSHPNTIAGLNANTTFTLTVKRASIDSPACTATDDVSVSFVARPQISLAETSASICQGGTAQLTVTNEDPNVEYNWAPQNLVANPFAASTTTLPLSQSQRFTLTAESTELQGCTATASVDVTVVPAPQIDLGAARTICAGQTVEIGTDPESGVSYSWQPANMVELPNSSRTSTLPLQNTTVFTLSASSDYNQSCAATGSVTVTVEQVPPVYTLTGHGMKCTGSAVSDAYVELSGSSSAVEYALIKDGAQQGAWTQGTGAALTWSQLEPGTYSVKARNRMGMQCEVDMNGSYTVREVQAPTLVSLTASPEVLCSGGTTTIRAEFTGQAPFTFDININGVPTSYTSNYNSLTFDYIPTTTTTFSISEISDAYCSTILDQTASVTVSIDDSGNYGIIADPSSVMCPGQDLTLKSAYTGNDVTYIWSTGETTDEITVQPAQDTQYRLTTITQNGCSISSTIDIKVAVLPDITISGLNDDVSYCGDAQPFQMTPSVPGGVFTSEPATPAITNGGHVDPSLNTTAGTYTVTYSYTDQYGCTASTSFDMYLYTKVDVNWYVEPDYAPYLDAYDYCLPNEADLQAYHLVGVPTSADQNGRWTINSTTAQAQTAYLTTEVGGETDLINATPGTYNITYTIGEHTGCVSSKTKSLTIRNEVTEVIENDRIWVYPGDEICLTSCNEAYVQASDRGGSFSISGNMPFTVDPNEEARALLCPDNNVAQGTYTAIYEMHDTQGCPKRFSKQFYVKAPVTIPNLGLKRSYCESDTPEQIIIDPATGTTGLINIYKDGSADPVLSSQDPNNSYVAFDPSWGAGNYEVVYSYNDGVCDENYTQNVTVYAATPVTITNDADYCLGDQIPLTADVIGGYFSCNVHGAIENSILDARTVGLGSVDVTYTITNQYSCQSSTTKTIYIHGFEGPRIDGLLDEYCEPKGTALISAYPTQPGNGLFRATSSGDWLTNNYDSEGRVTSATIDLSKLARTNTYGVVYEYSAPYGRHDGSNTQLTCTASVTGQFAVLDKTAVITNITDGANLCSSLPPFRIYGYPFDSQGKGRFELSLTPAVGGFTDNGDGSATINPAALAGNSYSITYVYDYLDPTDGSVVCTTEATVNFSVTESPILPDPTFVCSADGKYPIVRVENSSADTEYTLYFNNGQWGSSQNGNGRSIDFDPLTGNGYIMLTADRNGCVSQLEHNITVNLLAIDEVIANNLTCYGSNDGSIEVKLTGGFAPYEPNISSTRTSTSVQSNHAEQLAAGTYLYTVYDGIGCRIVDHVITIRQPNEIRASLQGTDLLCYNNGQGSIISRVEGGTTPYTYSWYKQPDMTTPVGSAAALVNIGAGDYQLVVTDANGCSPQNASQLIQTITEPAELTLSLDGKVDVVTTGQATGAIYITVHGGVPPYTYNWLGNSIDDSNRNQEDQTGLLAGTYYVSVTDGNGCSSNMLTVEITEPQNLRVRGSATDITCFGDNDGRIFISVEGGHGPFTFEWTDGTGAFFSNEQNLSGLSAGAYQLTVTDTYTGLTYQNTYVINEPPLLQAYVLSTTTQDLLCNGDNTGHIDINYYGGVQPYTVLWQGTDTQPQDPTSAMNLTAGTYSVRITDANGCFETLQHSISEPTELTLEKTIVQNACHNDTNGSASIVYRGGTPRYTVSWTGPGITDPTLDTQTGLWAGRQYTVSVIDNNGCNVQDSFTMENPRHIVAQETINDISCNMAADGSVSLRVDGGAAPYTYLWTDNTGATISTTPGATGLAPGTYDYKITDSRSCNYSGSVQITEPAALVAQVQYTNSRCNGSDDGTANAIVNGGTPDYVYSWVDLATGAAIGGNVDSVTGLAPGAYRLEVTDDNGCTASADFTITEPYALQFSYEAMNVSAYQGSDGSITILNVTGGTAPYSYSWSGGNITAANSTNQNQYNLTADDYYVVVSDVNSCSVSQRISITQPEALSVDVEVHDVLCGGGSDGAISVTQISGGVAPYTYSWTSTTNPAFASSQRNISGLEAGTYRLEIADFKGTATFVHSYTVNEPQPLSVAFRNSDTQVPCYGDKTASLFINVSGGTGAHNIIWQGPDIDPQGSYTTSADNLGAGTYAVFVTDEHNCTVSATASISQNAPIEATETITPNKCFEDNAASIDLSVTGGTGAYSFIWEGAALADPHAEDATMLGDGTYTVTITDGNHCQLVKSYTIQNPDLLSYDVDVTDISCAGDNNGQLVANVTGGVAPYVVQWTNAAGTMTVTDNRISSLSPDTYTLTVTDAAGCVKSEDYEVEEPTALQATLSVTQNLCAGESDGYGEVTVVQGSGTAPYSYEWRNHTTGDIVGHGASLANLSAGTYDVTVSDANGCTLVLSGTIGQLQPIEIFEQSITHVVNTGEFTGAIDLTVRGGSGVYTYSWVKDGIEIATDLDINNLAAGWYYLTVTDDNGCTGSYEVEITEPRALGVVATVVQNSCNGSNNAYIELSVSGGSNHSYSWTLDGAPFATTKDIYNLAPGTYEVTINYIGDPNPYRRTFTITEPDLLEIFTLSSSVLAIDCAGADNGAINIEVIGGTPEYNISWSGAGLPQPIQTPYSLSDLSEGTYRVDVSDANACTASETFQITTASPLALDYDIILNSCAGDNSASIDITVSGGTDPYTYQWTGVGVVADDEDQSGLSGGTYHLTVTDANGCSLEQTFDVADPITNEAVMSGGGDICIGQSATITLMLSGQAPFEVEYTDGATTQIVTLQEASTSFDVSPTVSTTYSLISVEDATGCKARVSGNAIVNVHPYPLANVASYNSDCCLGETVEVELLTANDGPWTITYVDDNGTNSVFTTSDANSILPVRPAKEGLNTYTLTNISTAFCSTTLDQKVEITAYPAPGLQVTVPSIACVGDVLDMQLSASGIGPWTVLYNEDGVDYSVSISTSPYTLSLTPLSTSTVYEFTSITSGDYCTSTLSNHRYEVTAEELPHQAQAITGNNQVCRGTQERYVIPAIANADSYIWELPQGWTIASGTGTNEVWLDIAPDALGGEISVRGVNECGEGLGVSYAVDVDPDFGPLGTISAPLFVCGMPTVFQLSTDLVTGAEYYEWQLPDGYTILNGDNTAAIMVEIDEYAQAGTVTVTAHSRCKAADPVSGFVNIRKLPFAEAGADFETACLDYAQLAATPADSITGRWTALRGVEIVFDDETLYNANVTNLAFGENPFRWEVTDGYCINYDDVTVYNYNPGITQPEVESETLCADTFNLRAPEPLYGDYRWTLIAGEGEIEDPESASTMIRGLSIKTANVIRWEVYSSSCSNTLDVTLISHSLDRLADAGSDTTIVNNSYDLQAKIINDENVTGTWSVVAGEGEFSEPNSPVTTVSGLAPGVNTLRWTLNGYGCEAYDEVMITTVDEPIANFRMDVSEGCRPLTVRFTNLTVGEATYSWDFDDGTTSSQLSPSHTFEESGYYDVKLVATGAARTDSITMQVYVYPHLDVQFYATNTKLYLPTAEAHFFEQTENGVGYSWNFGDGGTSTEANPVHMYEATGTYDVSLQVTSEFGCTDSLHVDNYIEVDNDGFLVFPTAFTPDVSHANGGRYDLNERRLDIFYPASRNVDTYKLEIFNQWGVKVFESNEITQGWDGYYLGECALQGAYSYIATGTYLNGVSFRHGGTFILIR